MYKLDRKTRRNLVRAQARRLGIPMRALWRMHQTGDYSALGIEQPRVWYKNVKFWTILVAIVVGVALIAGISIMTLNGGA